MAMTSDEIEYWVASYIEAQKSPAVLDHRHPLWWAIEKFMPPYSDGVSPDDCWLAILAVLARKPPGEVLAVLAAGPLEDLIGRHGSEFIVRIETEARRSPEFRHLLSGVWESGTPEVWVRVRKAQGPLW